MTVLITVVVLVGAVIVLVGRVFLKALIDQYGRNQAEPLAGWLAAWGRRLAARRAARRGDAVGMVLAAASPSEGRRAYEELQQRVVPTPEVAALLAATMEEGGPFAGRRALLVGVGAGAAQDISAALAHAGRQTIADVFLADPTESPTTLGQVDHGLGDMWEQLEASAGWADQRLSDGSGDFVAFILRTPISGDWGTDAGFDLDRLVSALLKPNGDVWLAVSDPGDPSAWPIEVVLRLPAPVRTVWKALRAARISYPARNARLDRYTVRLPANDAAALVIAITDPGGPRLERNLSGASPAQRYGAAVTLALAPDARDGRASVLPDDTALRAAEKFLEATNVRITSRLYGTERQLSLTAYPKRTVAWRLKHSPGAVLTPAVPTGGRQKILVSPDLNRNVDHAKSWLEAAISSKDESIAAAILATHGRAWIEEAAADPALELIEAAKKTFEKSSRAALWAHYLLALDSALRNASPGEEWFTGDFCDLADRTELGLLFLAERAEFTRLRNDMGGACTLASSVLNRLAEAEMPVDTAGIYAIATSRYVTANLLRQGGQYELARQLINTAASQFDPELPSHRVELTHCLYGRSVCDAMRGVAAVIAMSGWTADQAVFAQSLVTLANSHAAWFVTDYDRAIQFAQESHDGFARIGYDRYAQRAQRLVNLLDDWARRSGRPRATSSVHEIDKGVRELLAAAPGGRVMTLAKERPSRALSILQFALAYGDDPNTPRQVELPQYIAVTSSQNLITVTPPPARSYREADSALRSILGVGTGTPVPLAVD
jgi:hypothetical protein